MSKKDFFPQRPEAKPTIYAYELIDVPSHTGMVKVGYTDRDAQTRIREQVGTSAVRYRILYQDSAMKHDGTAFTDHDVHKHLRRQGIANPEGEWFRCSLTEVKAAVLAIRNGQRNLENRVYDFKMRPEQIEAVEKTTTYFRSFKSENPGKTPHFLWNAKMRFGKTFTTY